MVKNIFERQEKLLQEERNVFLQKYGIPVRTDLQRADEIEYATDTQILNKPKENYFAMMDFEEPIENIAERALKEIPFNSLALSSPITANAYAAYVLAKNPIVRGLGGSLIQLGREVSSYMTKEAATLGVAAGMDIDTRMKEHAKIDEEKANWPASLRLHDKVMGDVKRAGEFLTPFKPLDIERVKERLAAWSSEQKKVDEFNEKVKIVVDNFLERSGLAKNEKDGFWYDFGAVGGSVLSSIALLAIFRIPAIGAMLFAAAEGQGTYEEAIKAGITPEKAYGLGKINATWIAATEMLGDKFLSKILYGKGVLGKYSKKILESVKKGKMPSAQDVAAFAVGAAKSGGIESIQETSQNIGSDIIGNVGGISEKSASDIIKGGFYSGLLALPFGFLGGGVASLANFRQYADNVSKTLQNAGMEKETADKIGREMALTVTSSEFVDDSIKAVSSEINSPLTAEDRDPQKFAQVLTEAQKREVEESSWKVGEKVEQDALKAGVAPEVAEASGRVAQALNNNFYTLAKITPTDQKNFNISVLKGSQNNQVPFDMRGEGETQTADIDFSSLDSVFNSLPKDKAKKLFNAIREDARVRVLLDKAVLFREELLKKAKAKTLKEMRDYMTQEEKTALSNFANELEKTQLKIAKELIEKESDVFFQGGKGNARDLFATHNMNLAGAKQAVKMGGLAMPSMAIRKTDSERVAEFGDVSFVGNENLVKPSRSTEVYDRDAWTPSIYNSLRYRLSKNAKQKIEDILKKTGEEKQRSMYVYNIEEYFSDATRNEMALDLFLKEKGLPEEERQKKWNSPEYISWYNETFFDDATPYLFTENDDNTDMVERKFTLNNVMKVLRKQERAAGGYIGDHLFSVQELIKFFPQKFRNLKELRAKKQNLQTTEQIFEKIEELDKDFDSLIAELRTSGEEKEYGADRHAVGIAIANTGDLETQKHWLHNAGLPSDNETISKINKFAERIKNEIPVSYFEAKPRKVVDFGQFSGVIMPNTKDYDGLAKDLETKYSLPVFRIEKGNAQQYKEALSEIQKQVPTTFFQSGFHGKKEVFGELPEIKKESRTQKADVAILPEFQSILNEEIQPIKLTETYSDEILLCGEKDFYKHLYAKLEEVEGRYYVSSGSFKALVSKSDARKIFNTSNRFLSDDIKKANRTFAFQLNTLLPNAILAKKYADLNGRTDLSMERRFVPVEYNDGIYIVKLTLKEFSEKRKEFSEKIYEENGQKDYGEYNVEIVKKITLGSTALTLGKSVRPSQGSKDSISNNAPNVKGVTWAQALEGVVDNSGAYLPEVKVYNQNQESPRGMVEIDEQAHEAIIRVFENSDPSTIIHELAHVYLTMIHNASQISVDPEFQQLVADINDWLGEPAGENGAYSVEQQEMFARGFEGYMAEGKSPNKEMEGIFEKFAKWLAEVYESVKDYLQITPEVRSIFDRLLTTEEPVKKSKYIGQVERAKQLMESVKTGIKNEDALELPEMKALLSTASTRRPAVPKLNLLKDLKKHGANYANSAQIDKEAYANAGVKDSKEGIDDKPDLWLQKMGYMDFEESTEETVNQAWQMIEDALSGKEVYRLEDQDRVAQIEAYDENLKLLQEIFPDFMGVADTRRMISELERKGYRVVEKKDIKALEKALDRLTDTEKKKDEKQFLTMARRVREGVIAELEKRQIAGKDQMVELLKNAKTVEEITSVVEGVLGQVTSAWEQTEEGKQEQRKAELPKTDWGKKRAKLLAEINGIVKKAGESVAEAQKKLSSFVGRILTEEEAKEKERAERIIKNSNLEGQIIKALMESVRGEAHINPADINKIVARLAHSLQRNRLMTEYSVDDFIESAKKIQEKNYKKYIFKKLGDIFSRKVFEKVGTTKRLKYSPQAARFLTDAHKVWTAKDEDVQKEYKRIIESLGQDKDNPPDQFEVLRRMAVSLKADPQATPLSVFQNFYETVLSAVRGDAMSKRMEVLQRVVDEQNLRLAMEMGLDKRKIGKAELNFLLYGGTDFQTMLSILFGKVKIMIPESDSGVVELDLREELSPETEQIKAAIFVHEARQKLLKAVMDAYGLKSADQAVSKVAELQKEKMEILNYGKIKDEQSGALVARLFDENGKEYTNSKAKKETITKEEILTFWLWDQDHDFVETENAVEDYGLSGRLTRAYGREQLNAMFDKLTEEDKRFARSLQKMLADVHQQESEVHQRLYGFALPHKENYFPSVTERNDDSIDYQQQLVDNAKAPSFIKERVRSKMPIQKKVSPTKLVMAHLMRASEFIHEAEKFTKLRRLINNSDVLDAFIAKFGEEDGRKIYKKLQDLVVLQGPAQRKTKGELLALAEKAFNGWVKATLGAKILTGIKQFASSISFAENMPAEKWAMWFAKGMASHRKTDEFMNKMSPYIQTRYESGGVNETVARAMTQDSIQPFATRWNNLTNMLLINTRMGDKASLIYGGYPYLRYLIEEKGMTPEAAARAFEKQAVRSMQSSLKANTSMSQANADNLPVRLVLAFKNQQMQYLRKVADSYVQWKNKEISTKQFGKVLLLYIVLNPTVYVLLTLGWFADDEEERKKDLFRLLTAPLTQTLDAYPVAGAAMEFALESLYRVLQEEDLARPQSIGLPMVNDFYRDIGDVVSKINEGDAETMDFMMAFLDFAKYFGVPVGTLANTVGGVKDIATGKPVRGLMRTVGYTKNRSSKVTGDEE